MSGTSLDGIDVAIVDIVGRGTRLKLARAAFHTTPYASSVRAAIASVSDTMTHTGAVARLNFVLGELYAEAILETCRRKRIPVRSLELCGLHGQTIYHEAVPAELLGRRVASTMQIGEAAVVAERTGLPVISNFRERDIAAGGTGAPLVPYVDYLLLRDRREDRVVLNIGGIANITCLPAGCSREAVIAFDTGPGNMIIDALAAHLTGGRESCDRSGAIARRSKVNPQLLESMMSDPYLKRNPPKTAGREQFGASFVSGLLATGLPVPDLIATATEFTARSIACSIQQRLPRARVIVSGGGVHNKFLMHRLSRLLPECAIVSSAAYGIHPDAKEAVAFAVLAYECFHHRAANMPSATGSRHPVVLGKLTY
jgi:anhydro-N-acetylmuramic acid kinase